MPGIGPCTIGSCVCGKPPRAGKPRLKGDGNGARSTGTAPRRPVNAISVTVVSLGAWCDLDPREEDPGSGIGTSFKVREFAVLSDGREVTLLDDRGWTTSAPLGGTAGGQDTPMPVARIVRNVFNVVLPDDAEVTGEEHEWQRFVQRLREAGVAVTPGELQALPYRVILSDRLRSRLGLAL